MPVRLPARWSNGAELVHADVGERWAPAGEAGPLPGQPRRLEIRGQLFWRRVVERPILGQVRVSLVDPQGRTWASRSDSQASTSLTRPVATMNVAASSTLARSRCARASFARACASRTRSPGWRSLSPPSCPTTSTRRWKRPPDARQGGPEGTALPARKANRPTGGRGREGRSAAGSNAAPPRNLPKLEGETFVSRPRGDPDTRTLPGEKTPGPAPIDPRAAPPNRPREHPWLR